MSIRKYRIKKGMTQEELSDVLHIARPTVTCWETGVNSPRADMLLKIASVLSCSVDDLLRSDE